MPVRVKVLEIDETMNGDALTIGIPDEAGQQVVLSVVDEDLAALKVGGSYTISFVPFVPQDSPAAVAPAANTPAASDAAAAVPADHPLVIDPAEAAQLSAAIPVEEDSGSGQ